AGPRRARISLGGGGREHIPHDAGPPRAGDDQLPAAVGTPRPPPCILILRLELLAARTGDQDRHGRGLRGMTHACRIGPRTLVRAYAEAAPGSSIIQTSSGRGFSQCTTP